MCAMIAPSHRLCRDGTTTGITAYSTQHDRQGGYRAGLVAGLGCAVVMLMSTSVLAQSVGAAQSFAIVGGTAITAAPPLSNINGDVGIAPAVALFITGFPANATITPPFVNHGNDAFAIAARASLPPCRPSAGMARIRPQRLYPWQREPTAGSPITRVTPTIWRQQMCVTPRTNSSM